MSAYQLLVIALAVEAIWETAKLIWQEGKLNIDRLGAVILGIVLCILAQVDFFDTVAVPLCYPTIGMALTGIIVSRGANFLHDFMSAIAKFADNE